MTKPHMFRLERDHDVTGSSGLGHVADGVVWADGTTTVRWLGDRASTVHWASIADAIEVHGHGGHTRFVWENPLASPDADRDITPEFLAGLADTEAHADAIAGPGDDDPAYLRAELDDMSSHNAQLMKDADWWRDQVVALQVRLVAVRSVRDELRDAITAANEPAPEAWEIVARIALTELGRAIGDGQ